MSIKNLLLIVSFITISSLGALQAHEQNRSYKKDAVLGFACGAVGPLVGLGTDIAFSCDGEKVSRSLPALLVTTSHFYRKRSTVANQKSTTSTQEQPHPSLSLQGCFAIIGFFFMQACIQKA